MTTKMDYDTMLRVSEMLQDANYQMAGAFVFALAQMPEDMRDNRAAQPRPSFAEGPLYKPTPVEALAERLAKVEDRLARVDATQQKDHIDVHARIDKVAEIIGERVSGLVDDIAAVRDSAKRAHERIDDQREIVGSETAVEGAVSVLGRLGQLAQALSDLEPGWRGWKPEPAFPTGGGSTAEAAAEAVLPVPQRGDRVRLEGAVSWTGTVSIPDGWYDVIGHDNGNKPQFQIKYGERMPWLDANTEALKEVRHADHT